MILMGMDRKSQAILLFNSLWGSSNVYFEDPHECSSSNRHQGRLNFTQTGEHALAAIILDFDGLVLDTETPLYTSWQEVCDAHNIPMEHAWWANLLTTRADPPEAYDLLEDLTCLPFDREQVRAARHARELQLIADQGLLPGVAELISQAKSLSLPIGIASNSERAWVTGHLSRLGLLEAFDQIKCRDEVLHGKPRPDLYQAVLEALGVPAGQAVAFEDSPGGVAAAKAAGVFCIAVPNSVTRSLDFPGADRVIPSLSGVSIKELMLTFGIGAAS